MLLFNKITKYQIRTALSNKIVIYITRMLLFNEIVKILHRNGNIQQNNETVKQEFYYQIK